MNLPKPRLDMTDPERVDNMDARRELVRRMNAGEISLDEAQRELSRLKRLDMAKRRAR